MSININMAEQAEAFRNLTDEQYCEIANGRVSVADMLAGIEAARREKAEKIAQDALDQRCLDSAVQIVDIAQVLDVATAAALAALTEKE